MNKRNKKKGSVILPTLLIIMIIVATGSTYLTMSFNEFKLATRNQDLQKSINMAEAGVEKAMLAMKDDSWSGWSTVASDHYYISKPLTVGLSTGTSGYYRVFVSVLDADAPIVFSEGVITSLYGTIKKQIRLDFGKKGLFMNGLTAKDTIDWNGKNVYVDSYHSDFGDYDFNFRRDGGSVASLSILDGAVSPGNGDIWGYVATGGGAPDFGPNGTLKGRGTPSGLKIDPKRIAYDFYAEIPNVSAPTPTSPLTTLPASGTIGIPSATTPTYYKISSFSNNLTDTLIIDGPIVVIATGDWASKGEIQITTSGSLEIYTSANLDVGGNGAINLTNKPSNLVIYGTNPNPFGQLFKMSGNGAIKAAIYAPNANLEMKGGGTSGTFMGAAVAQKIKMTGNSNFHYDEALKNFGGSGGYRIERWRELIDGDEKVPMNTPSEMIAYAVQYEKKDVFNQPSKP